MASSIDITKDIQSLTTFRRQSAAVLKQLKKTKRPVFLTVKGRATAVVQDAESYQRLVDCAERMETEDAIRRGLDDIANGRTIPAKEAFARIRKKYGIPG